MTPVTFDPYLPIVYVRGYAATQDEINQVVDDPFYGFNTGSTHVRVGPFAEPVQMFFESPLVRLMTDHGYRDAFENGAQMTSNRQLKTIWVYRYYDQSADTYGDVPERLPMESVAKNLRIFINQVKTATGARKVHLVAHSMGGLVCRCLLQKIYIDEKERGSDHVARFFTYATPHGGIHFRNFLGQLEKARDILNLWNSAEFGKARMFEYFTPEDNKPKTSIKSFDPRQMPSSAFSVDDVFCLIGTNATDYSELKGWASYAVGQQSDGLVQIGSAYVTNAHRAYVHRCHSGRYGIVNSEEGYLHLERFLFGNIRTRLYFSPRPPANPSGGEAPRPPKGGDILKQFLINIKKRLKLSPIQADIRISLPGSSVYLNERTRAHLCPVIVTAFKPIDDRPEMSVELASIFTGHNDKERAGCDFAVDLAFHEQSLSNYDIQFRNSFYNVPDWKSCLIARLNFKNEELSCRASWLSDREEKVECIIKQNEGVFIVCHRAEQNRPEVSNSKPATLK
jgi:hypothetical protein